MNAARNPTSQGGGAMETRGDKPLVVAGSLTCFGISCLTDGNIYVSRQIAEEVWAQSNSSKAAKSGLGLLSARELDVLKLLAEGNLMQECSSQLVG